MFCPHCGNKVSDEANFCENCGKKVNNVELCENTEKSTPAPRRRHRPFWLIPVGIVVTLILIPLIILGLYAIIEGLTVPTTSTKVSSLFALTSTL